MKNIIKFSAIFVLFIIIPTQLFSADDIRNDEEIYQAKDLNLYKVTVSSYEDANNLKTSGAEPALRVRDGYLVFLIPGNENLMTNKNLVWELLTTDINRNQLALDMNRDGSNIGRYPLIYQEGELRLFRTDVKEIEKSIMTPGLASLQTENIKIIYREPRKIEKIKTARSADIEALIAEVKQDSLESYLDVLQAFNGRVTGTASNYASRDWCANKFTEFGYDSVVIDSFAQTIYGSPADCQNIIAYKIGSTYPEFQIVVGAHRDAVPNSPGADDNGTGTGGVLEIARIISEIETELTIVFVLFDAEEQGLYGSWFYANRAANQGDSIVMMLNMDMIAFYQNSTAAALYTGNSQEYADVWTDLAATLPGININGVHVGSSGQSDHHPFDQNGYDVVFVAESIFSNVYHSPQDSTTYLDFDYFKRMVQASLATTYYVSSNFVPLPQLIISYPNGVPDIQTPGLSLTLEIAVETKYDAHLVPGSGFLHYSSNGGAFNSMPLAEIEDGLYEVTLPAQSCGNQIDLYSSLDEISGGTFSGLDDGKPFSISVANGKTIVFSDDFETDKGWTVSGDAVDGSWERGIPAGGGSRGDPPTDYDGSGFCYLTDNVAGNSDVDDGLTSLFSPTIDASQGSIKIDYARWYCNDAGNAPNADEMRVFVSNDDGAGWTAVEIVGPVEQSSGSWNRFSFQLSNIIAPSSLVKLRFNVSDYGSPSVVEAAIDAVAVTSYSCDAGLPIITTESLPNWIINQAYSEQLNAIGGNGELSFSDKYNELDGTGLNLTAEGILSGVPIVSGIISFTAIVTDGAEATDEQAYNFEIILDYICGDADADGMVNILDIVRIINFIYKSGPPPDPIHAAEVDNLVGLNILDVVYLINYKYKGGPDPDCQ